MKSQFARFSPEWWAWMTTPEPNSGCLLWMGSVCKSGYGRVASSPRGSPVLVHRVALSLALGHPISSGVKVLHRCDTPSCVNPDHLFIGSQGDNMRDMFKKGRGRPRGSGTKRVQLEIGRVSAPVAVKELSSQDSHSSVRIADGLHLTRTTAMATGWRHVTGVPARRPTTAMVLANRPENGTEKPSRCGDHRLAAVATVAPSCALVVCSSPAERTPECAP